MKGYEIEVLLSLGEHERDKKQQKKMKDFSNKLKDLFFLEELEADKHRVKLGKKVKELDRSLDDIVVIGKYLENNTDKYEYIGSNVGIRIKDKQAEHFIGFDVSKYVAGSISEVRIEEEKFYNITVLRDDELANLEILKDKNLLETFINYRIKAGRKMKELAEEREISSLFVSTLGVFKAYDKQGEEVKVNRDIRRDIYKVLDAYPINVRDFLNLVRFGSGFRYSASLPEIDRYFIDITIYPNSFIKTDKDILKKTNAKFELLSYDKRKNTINLKRSFPTIEQTVDFLYDLSEVLNRSDASIELSLRPDFPEKQGLVDTEKITFNTNYEYTKQSVRVYCKPLEGNIHKNLITYMIDLGNINKLFKELENEDNFAEYVEKYRDFSRELASILIREDVPKIEFVRLNKNNTYIEVPILADDVNSKIKQEVKTLYEDYKLELDEFMQNKEEKKREFVGPKI